MPSKSWAVIYCPKEGSPRTHRRWKKIRRYLEQKGIAFDFVQSEGQGSVERLASMMTRAGYGTLVVVGGDAALNHALCGMMKTQSPTGELPVLGVIPNGFGNDFARYWGFRSDDYRKTIDTLALHKTRKVDVGVARIQGKVQEETLYFLDCLNLGVAASVTNLKRRTGRLFGLKTLSYLCSALLLVFSRMSFRFKFKVNGEQIRRAAMSVCVGSAHGYGQTPSAVPYNGLLDITLVSKPQMAQLFQGLWLLFTGRFLSHRGVEVWRTRQVSFTEKGNAMLSVDGRVYHGPFRSLQVDILPERIEFLIP